MIESLGLWAISSIIFVKFFGYSMDSCMSAFYIMAGFGLLISHKRRTFKVIGKALGEAGDSLVKNFGGKKKEENQ